MKQYAILMPCILLLVYVSALHANSESYYRNHASGWHWYNETVDRKTNEKSAPQNEKERAALIDNEMKEVQLRLDTARKEMVLRPTEVNVMRFIVLQQQMINQAEQVSKSWQNVLLKYPELDYSLVNPENSLARKIAADVEDKKEDEAIEQLSKKSGLFFFYRSTCPYCRGFAPTVKAFAEKYHIKVIPITTDGISLPEFPNSFKDEGQGKRFNVKFEPALFAVNPYTQNAFPITYGLISYKELRRKILEMSDQLIGEKKINES